MSELMDTIGFIIPASSVRIELVFVIILGFLFWMKAKNAQIKVLKGQINFLVELNTENFIEILIEREKSKDEELEKLQKELRQLKAEKETGKIVDQKLIKEKEGEIRIIKSSAEATTNAINTSLDYYSTGINTMGSILNMRKELRKSSFITVDE